MFPRERLISLNLLIALCVACSLFESARSEDQYSLDQLLADYKAYGLPLPAEGSELAILPSPSSRNGHRDKHLVLIAKQATPSSKAIYWVGCDEGWQWLDFAINPAPHELASLQGTEPVPIDYQHDAFNTFPDLALSIQCYAMNRKELAAALLKRSHLEPKPDHFKRLKPRPKDDRVALAQLAWNHYCNRFAVAERAERSAIVVKMKLLMTTPFPLKTEAHRSIVADMEKTLNRVPTSPESLEASIEGLLDFMDSWGSFLGSGWRDQRNNVARLAAYQKLQNAGLEAVPLLLKHVDDFRLTRRIQVNQHGSYTWNLRVADLVAQLLIGIANETFAYDFLETQGRGVGLDRRHVAHWWTDAGASKERDFLLNSITKAVPSNNSDSIAPTLKVLGAKYPDDLLKLFEEQQKNHKLDHIWFDALEESKVATKEKLRLLLVSANSKDSWEKTFALRVLAHMNHPDAPKYVIEILEQLPKTPSVPYWQSDIGLFSQIAYGLDNDQVWETLLKTAKRVDMGQRMEMIGTFSRQKPGRMRERAIRFLKEFLKDKEGRKGKQTEGLFSGPSAGFIYENIRVCDLATEQLAYSLDLKDRPESNWAEADWDKFRARVEAELAKRSQGQNTKGGK